MIALPPDYLSLDQLFALVGSEMYDTEWTGEEPKLIATLPSDYWRLPDTISELCALHQSSDWLSEDVRTYLQKKAIERFKDVAAVISHRCWLGEYIAFLSYPDGQLRGVDIKHITSESFLELIYQPMAANRSRLWFQMKVEPPRRMQPSAGITIDAGSASAPAEVTKAAAGKLATQQMYDNWVELEKKYRFKDDGTRRKREEIAKAIAKNPLAVHPLTKEPPTVANVKRRLSDERRKWVEKIRQK